MIALNWDEFHVWVSMG